MLENLCIGLPGRRDPEREEYVFACFPRLKERLKQSGNTLSGGEQQMLAIARCLMMRPKLIILDEPTEGIMPRLVSQIRREIHRINQTGVSILLVEQNVETALKLCPRVFLMEKGTIVYSGASHELKSQTRNRPSISRVVPVTATLRRGEIPWQRSYPAAVSSNAPWRAALSAGTANLTIMKDAFAQASGPIVIGHHCDLTGVISSWGFWHDKAPRRRSISSTRAAASPAARWNWRPKTPNLIRPAARASCET